MEARIDTLLGTSIPVCFGVDAMDVEFGLVCEQMKPAESNVELVRYHKKNLGILKEAHPAYIDVSPDVVSMLDHIILIFIYVESLREDQKSRRRRGQP